VWRSPNNINPEGYLNPTGGRLPIGSGLRSLNGSIDQRPNATILTPLALGPVPAAVPPGTPIQTGYLAYPEMYPQVSMDSDAERGRLSNNFYRDMDVRTSTGNSGGAGAPGSAARFNESDHYFRWVSILRLADMLRPLGVGPLEAPFEFTGPTTADVRVFTPRTTTLGERNANNARYTTLGEALAAAMGYENRNFNTIPRHAGAHTRDINLLRSPYALPLAGESTGNGPFHLKPPPGSRTTNTPTTAEPGDDSMDTLLFDRGNLRLDHFVPFVDADTQDTVLDLDTTGTDAERVVGPGVPMAQMVLEQFETPATDPANPAPLSGENAGRFAPRQGLINVNTAPVEVLRLLPGVSPRAYAQPAAAALAATTNPSSGTARPATLAPVGAGTIGDADWFRNQPGVRPTLPVNQTLDLAAGIAGYRDMVPVMLSRAAAGHIQTLRAAGVTAGNSFPDAAAGTTYVPVASLFLPVFEGGGDDDPYRHVDSFTNTLLNPRSVSRIMGIESQPGFRSVGELLSVRSRENESLPTGTAPRYTSRWPLGVWKQAFEPRHSPWAAAPYNIDALGYDQSILTTTDPFQRRELNSTFDEIDPQAGRIDRGVPTTPGDLAAREDDPFDNPYERRAFGERADARLAVSGMPNEYDEKLILANNFLNTVTTRSDVYAVWFTLAGFQKSDVEGLDASDPITPSVRRRFVMVVDRSNVATRGTKPRILLMKEVPMPRE
jgi:hypothetical protein